MAFLRFEDLRVFQLAEKLCWEMINELGPSLNAYLKSIGRGN